ncbi:helix-turn-helix transcriptional regulator [Desulfoprunum benzoelyticum]|uniref:DNA-binding transcriptional ArsR family regulator n=1 Tax=Desulfoprunum benzoelyticum TaxID=1506996 RepID=A0A840UZY3_9BACT|nr:metalloregulator ArsR/SmtB family transcription factor [Desulfoprunum benzoelyticum]MBB5349004.1 DNA-binding transcriptional ArsR family regulator [Desulfoprunum benzoelyticum]MBM9531790.1 helix-turn-helix transcriptional regulator [Desulfoprunum benzoelyticum]
MEHDVCGSRIIHPHKIAAARENALPATEIADLSQIFKALADPSRLRLLYALTREEMCVCDLSALLEISESAVSHQLRLLRNLQIVANRREGTVLYYRLKDHHVSELIALALEHLREG